MKTYIVADPSYLIDEFRDEELWNSFMRVYMLPDRALKGVLTRKWGSEMRIIPCDVTMSGQSRNNIIQRACDNNVEVVQPCFDSEFGKVVLMEYPVSDEMFDLVALEKSVNNGRIAVLRTTNPLNEINFEILQVAKY
jgi:hypothetical protein